MTAHMAAYGRIVADVQTKPVSSGGTMAFTRMAVSLPCRTAENGEVVMWLGVTAFGRQAEALAGHHKGDPVSVSGQLQANQWTGQDGSIQNGYTLVVDSVISARTVRPGRRKQVKNTDRAKQPGTAAPGWDIYNTPEDFGQ